MLTNNYYFKYETQYNRPFEITQCRTNCMFPLQHGATKIMYNIFRINHIHFIQTLRILLVKMMYENVNIWIISYIILEDVRSNRQNFLLGDKYTEGNFSSILFILYFTVPLNYIILHYFINLLEVTLNKQLSILYRFGVFTWQGSRCSRPVFRVSLSLHQRKVPIYFGECGGYCQL